MEILPKMKPRFIPTKQTSPQSKQFVTLAQKFSIADIDRNLQLGDKGFNSVRDVSANGLSKSNKISKIAIPSKNTESDSRFRVKNHSTERISNSEL